VLTTSRVWGLIWETVPVAVFVTQTKPPAIAMPPGALSTGILSRTVFVSGSMTKTAAPHEAGRSR
jgi:hypothetical protein